jgi:hypothetical protein
LNSQLRQVEKIAVPHALVVVVLDPVEPLGLEELHGLAHDLARPLVGVEPVELVRVQ